MLSFACLGRSSWVRIEVTGLDQNFVSVEVGEALVLKGLSIRDTGYGLRATLGSRSFFESVDPCNLAQKWESVEDMDTLPKVLMCGAAAHAISISISALILLYDFGGFLQNYLLLEFINIYCVSYTQGYSVFVFRLLLGFHYH